MGHKLSMESNDFKVNMFSALNRPFWLASVLMIFKTPKSHHEIIINSYVGKIEVKSMIKIILMEEGINISHQIK